MRIYLACTIRGDRSRLEVARALATVMRQGGHELLTERFLDDRAEDEDGRLSEAEVFQRDLAWLDECDVLVAEASGSSYGVGFEVGYVLARAGETGKAVVVLYDRRARDRVSRLISGNTHPHCVTVEYASADEAAAALAARLQELAGRSRAPGAEGS